MQEQLLQGLDVRALRALLQRTGAQGVLGRGRIGRAHGGAVNGVAVVDERQRVPVRPRTLADLCFDTAVGKALPFNRPAVADVVAHMPVLGQRQPGYLGQRGHRAPSTALALGVAEHGIRALVRAAVCAVGAGDGLVRADGVQHGLTAAGPGVALRAANAVADHLLIGNVLLVAIGSAGAVVGWVLLRLAGQEAARGLAAAGAVPIRMAYHPQTVGHKMLGGKGRVHAITHGSHPPSHLRARAAGTGCPSASRGWADPGARCSPAG